MPTRNRAELLKRSIASVLAQTYRNLELVVVNDASTDHTRECSPPSRIRGCASAIGKRRAAPRPPATRESLQPAASWRSRTTTTLAMR